MGANPRIEPKPRADAVAAHRPARLAGSSIGRGGTGSVVAAAVVLCVALFFATPFQAYSVSVAFGYAIGASAVAIAFCSLGILALEQAALMGIGAFAAVNLLDGGWPVPFVLVASAGLTLVIGALFGWLAGRVGIFPYAIIGFSFSYLFVVVGSGPMLASLTGGDLGRPVLRTELLGVNLSSGVGPLLLSGGCLLLVLAIAAALLRSSVGSALRQVGTNLHVASTLGINVRRMRTLVVTAIAGVSGVAGAVTAIVTNYVAPRQFGPSLVVLLLAIALVGGTSYSVGPLLGALTLVALPELLGLTVVDRQILVAAAFLTITLLSGQGLAHMGESVIDRVRGRSTRAQGSGP